MDTEVAVKADGTLLGFRTRAVDDAGAYLRYEPLGGVIWSQVAAGMYKWRNIHLEFTQAMTNKAPVSPNRGYSRMQQLWFTERVVDIVAHKLGFDPVELRKKNYVQPEEMPYETPSGGVYDSGDYPRALDMALELVGYDASRRAARRPRVVGSCSAWGSARRSTRAPTTSVSRSTSTPSCSSRATTRSPRSSSTSSARSWSRSERRRRARASRRPPRRSSRTSWLRLDAITVRAGHDVLELARGLLRHVGEPVRGLRPRRGQGRQGLAEQMRSLASVVFRGRGGNGARRRLRAPAGQPRGRPALHGARGDREREERGLPGTSPPMNCRYVYRPQFEVPDKEPKFGNLTLTYATQIHACVVEIDPETASPSSLDYAAVDDCGEPSTRRSSRAR